MSIDPWRPVADLEAKLSEITGAPYVVCVNSCTAALQLALEGEHEEHEISIPRRTYVSVPMAIIHAGRHPIFRDETWSTCYQLAPLPIWDCAREFRRGMYVPKRIQCISFSSAKVLGVEQGGAILHSDKNSQEWYQRMRYDGRLPGCDISDDTIELIGHHCPMLPSVASALLMRLCHMFAADCDPPALPPHTYPDISQFPAFK